MEEGAESRSLRITSVIDLRPAERERYSSPTMNPPRFERLPSSARGPVRRAFSCQRYLHHDQRDPPHVRDNSLQLFGSFILGEGTSQIGSDSCLLGVLSSFVQARICSGILEENRGEPWELHPDRPEAAPVGRSCAQSVSGFQDVQQPRFSEGVL